MPETSWLRCITDTNPSSRIEVLDRLPLDRKNMITTVRLHGELPPKISRLIRKIPGVRHVQVLKEQETAILYRVTAQLPSYIPIFQKIGITDRYPFWVEHGRAIWVITGSRAGLKRFIAGIRPLVPEVIVEEIRPGLPERAPPGLTPHQQELVQMAFEKGYYDVPRGISLTELARQLEISKGTLSLTLARAERKLLTTKERILVRDEEGPPSRTGLISN